jgi:hypothetical protein
MIAMQENKKIEIAKTAGLSDARGMEGPHLCN